MHPRPEGGQRSWAGGCPAFLADSRSEGGTPVQQDARDHMHGSGGERERSQALRGAEAGVAAVSTHWRAAHCSFC